MADEAILRIKMEGDAASGATRPTVGGSTSAPAGSGPSSADSLGSPLQKIANSIGDVIGGRLGGLFDTLKTISSQMFNTNSYNNLPRVQVSVTPDPAAPAGSSSSLANRLPPDQKPIVPPSSLSNRLSPQGLDEAIPNALPGAATGFAESIAASIPVIGAVVAGGAILYEAIQKLGAGIIGAADAVGQFAVRITSASNDSSQAAALVGDAFRKSSDANMWIFPAIGIVHGVWASLFETLASFQSNVEAYANRFGGFSPEVTQAQAESSVISVLNDMRRAQEAGPEMARFIEQSTEVREKFEDIKVKALVKLMPLAEAGLGALEGMLPVLETILEVVSYHPLFAWAKANADAKAKEKADADPTNISLPTSAIFGGQNVPFRGTGASGPQPGVI